MKSKEAVVYLFLPLVKGISTQNKRFYDLNKAELFSNGKEIFILAFYGLQHFFLKSCDTEYLSRVIIQFLL
jgi:hypothetical protein